MGEAPEETHFPVEPTENGCDNNKDRNEEKKEEKVPPDGGAWAWLVMFCSFLCNGLVLGLNNAYGVIYIKLNEQLEKEGDPNASSKAALMGSMTFGFTLCCSPLAGILVDRIGIRATVFLGAAIATISLLISSFVSQWIGALYLTYGFCLGLGLSLIYSPSLTIVGHYFRKRFGLINGLVTCGSAVFTLLMYFLLDFLIHHIGLNGCFLVLAAMMSLGMLSALTFAPVLDTRHDHDNSKHKFLNLDNWRNPCYVVWVMAIFFGLFGYLVPLVHLLKFVKRIPGLEDVDGRVTLLSIQLTSLVARIACGKMADFGFVKRNRVLLQQIAFIAMGILTMMLNYTSSWPVLIIFCLLLGAADGCFWCAEGPIAYDLVGAKGAAQALGFMKGVMGISFAAGPPIAGALYDHLGDYYLAFMLAGVPPILAGLSMTYITLKRRSNHNANHVLVQKA